MQYHSRISTSLAGQVHFAFWVDRWSLSFACSLWCFRLCPSFRCFRMSRLKIGWMKLLKKKLVWLCSCLWNCVGWCWSWRGWCFQVHLNYLLINSEIHLILCFCFVISWIGLTLSIFYLCWMTWNIVSFLEFLLFCFRFYFRRLYCNQNYWASGVCHRFGQT